MRPILFSIIFAFSLNQTQSPPEHYEGSSTHAHPPESWQCSQDATDPARKCACHRDADPSQMCEDEPIARECKAFCWEKSHFIEDPNGPHTNPSTGKRGKFERSHYHCQIHCPLPGEHPPAAPPAEPDAEPQVNHAAMSHAGHR